MNNDITSRRSLKNYARTVLSEDSPTNIALLKMFDEIIDNAPDCWTPVSEGLPKRNGVYLVTRIIEETAIIDASYFDGQNTWHRDTGVNHGRPYLNDVIAWMPRPEPYKEV